MLEIVRQRPWSVPHTVLDNEDGPASDLSHLVSYKSQLRAKTATRNRQGFFEHALVADVTVGVVDNIITLSLTSAQTTALSVQEALLDCIGITASGATEVILEPEPVRITNRPSIP